MDSDAMVVVGGGHRMRWDKCDEDFLWESHV